MAAGPASPRRRRSSAAATLQSGEELLSLTRKTLPPFLDSDETVHFFNDDLVLRTNAIRIADDGDDSARRRSERAGEKEVEENENEEDDDYEHLSDEYDDYDDYDDEQYDDCGDDDEDEDEEDKEREAVAAAASAAKKNSRRLRPSAWAAASALAKRNSLRSESIPDPAPLYDEVFDAFDDLYVAYYSTGSESALRATEDAPAHEQEKQHVQRKPSVSAQSAIATFGRRAHAAKSYRYRKRCEFLRVCYQRALETEPALEESPDAVLADVAADRPADSSRKDGEPPLSSASAASSVLLGAARRDDLVETSVPTLHPRKWPHLPFRFPRQWMGSVDDAAEFLERLGELPEVSLLYEPVDVQRFVGDVLALLKAAGVRETGIDGTGVRDKPTNLHRQEPLPEEATAGLIALLGMGVQLQSFSMLSLAALQLATLGYGTLLGDSGAVSPRLKGVLEMYWGRLVKQSTRPSFAATYTRSLASQWKISACQPSSSDTIATDGLFLYVFGRSGLLKIGTGNGNTVRDFVYAHNRAYTRSPDAERSWMCCIGTHLFCRTIVMPSNRVDRINTSNLERIEELYFSPNRSVSAKGVSESSVYAMITDGVDLYTIRCVDTFKRPTQPKPADGTTRSQTSKPTRDPLVERLLKPGQLTSDPLSALNRTSAEATIKIGDRVVRGPDWKWGSQDGVEGSTGTVERVSTWGGVPGSGVTVRWDKTQRVNTYRWGAESCYDLVIVIVKDDQILERKALPSKPDEKSDSSGANGSGEPPSPRHQFVLFRHDVARLVSTMELDQEDLDVFLDLSLMEAEIKDTAGDKKDEKIDESPLVSALHSHSLSLCTAKSSWMCDGGLASCDGNNAAKRFRCDSGCDFDLCGSCARSTWIAKTSTVDQDAAVDSASAALPTAAVAATTTASDETPSSESKQTEVDDRAESKQTEELSTPKAASPETVVSPETGSSETVPSPETATSPETVTSPGTVTSPKTASLETIASPEVARTEAPPTEEPFLEMPALEPPAPSSSESSPFEISRTSMLYDEESGGMKASETATAKAKDPKEREDELVNELVAFWGGLYTRKECLVALRRNNFSLTEASVWIDTCAGDLRKKLLVPTVSSVTLEAKPGSGALDPVLLVAGSFYMSSGQLCIVSPPGLYTSSESQSEKAKRAATSCDAAWFFSVESGKLLSEEKEALPVLLKGIPAGSPTCVDKAGGQIFVYSGYLNCLEVYVDPAQRAESSMIQRPSRVLSETTSLGELGEELFSQLHLLMLNRWSLPAYKHARAGLQDILFHTEREPSAASSKPATPGDSAHSGSQKSKARRIKNIRGRIKMLEEIGQRDPPGYFIPFCVDFQDDGVLHLLKALVVCGRQVCGGEANVASDADDCEMLKDVLCLLSELLKEIDYAGLSVVGECENLDARELYRGAESVLLDLSRGKSSLSRVSGDADERRVLVASKVISTAQAVLSWGMRKGMFCREKKATALLEIGDAIVAAGELDLSVLAAAQSTTGLALRAEELPGFKSEQECAYRLLQVLLCSPTDSSRVDIADFVPLDFDEFTRLLTTLFNLSALESKSVATQGLRGSYSVTSVSVVTKALHSLVNYCSVRLYSEKDEAFESKPKLKESGSRATAVELFNAFALICIRACSELLTQSEETSAILEPADLQASAVGTILPLVMTTISNYPALVSTKVRHGIADLLKALDKRVFRGEEAAVSPRPIGLEPSDTFFAGDQVVETPHPYNQSQSSFRRVVRIPGASLLHIDFDPRSCTSGEADFVFISSGRSWFNSDRMAFADGGIGDSGGCFFGAYAHGNWPTQGLSIVGDTATIMLCATSQARDNANASEKQRWGLRCTVRGLFSSPSVSWLGDVSCGVASACSVVAEQLMQSISMQQVEQQCRKWISARELFSPASRRYAIDMREIVECNGCAGVLKLFEEFTRLHKSPKTSMNQTWTDALGAAAAVLLAQTNGVVLSAVARAVKDPSFKLPDPTRSEVQAVAAELQRVEQWMIRHVQLLNEWHYLQEDGVSIDDMKERYADNLDGLRELCELQSIPFHGNDVNGSILKLHSQLQRQESETSEDKTNSYELVAREVLEKAQLLLSRYTKEKQPGASGEIPCANKSDDKREWGSDDRQLHRVATAGDFFRCAPPSSVISDCAQIQSRRLRERIAGFNLSQSALVGVESPELTSWFVGRGLVALSVTNTGEPDYFHGCLLGDNALLTEFDALYVRLHMCEHCDDATSSFGRTQANTRSLDAIGCKKVTRSTRGSQTTVPGRSCSAPSHRRTHIARCDRSTKKSTFFTDSIGRRTCCLRWTLPQGATRVKWAAPCPR